MCTFRYRLNLIGHGKILNLYFYIDYGAKNPCKILKIQFPVFIVKRIYGICFITAWYYSKSFIQLDELMQSKIIFVLHTKKKAIVFWSFRFVHYLNDYLNTRNIQVSVYYQFSILFSDYSNDHFLAIDAYIIIIAIILDSKRFL